MKRILVVLLAVFLMVGCKKQMPKTQQTIFAMDTVMNLTIYGADCEKAAADLQVMINSLEKDWSATREDSIPNNTTRLTQEQSDLLDQLTQIQGRTDGLFDMYLGGVMEAWGFYDKNYRVPAEAELTAARQESRMDLGGAMKGYAADRAVVLLDSMDIDYAILDLGGNIQTYQNKPDGTPWQIGIQNPNGGDPLGVISVTGTAAVVTSGDYQRYFEQDGQTYHHIIDPRTLQPAQSGLRSVTVISKSGLTADCLSTALFVMGLEDGSEFWRESNDFEAVFLTTDGKLYATEGVSLSGCEYEVICR